MSARLGASRCGAAAIYSGVIGGLADIRRVDASFRRVYPQVRSSCPPSSEAERALADLLKASLGRREVVLTQSGTAALFLVLRLLAEGRPFAPEVIMPALCCRAVYYAALAAGCRPVLADSRAEDGNLDPASVETALSPRTVAIVAVHLYGRRPPLAALHSLAERAGIFLLEDAASALGASSFGPSGAVVVSLGRGKILSAGGGGAIATDDADLAQAARNLTADLRAYHPTPTERRRFCLPIVVWGAGGRGPWPWVDWAVAHAPRALGWWWAQPMSAWQVERALRRWPSLPARLARRTQAAWRYRALLSGSAVQVLGAEDADGVVWRLPVLLPDGQARARAGRLLLAHGVFPAALYEPLSRVFPQAERAPSLAVAEGIGERVLALDVSPRATDERIALTARLLREAAAKSL